MNGILILDDDKRISEELAEYLRHHHYQVYQAGKAADAREILHQELIDLILLDHNLPEVNGLRFLQEIHQTQPKVNVIMISSSGNLRLQTASKAMGAACFLQKPIHLSQIQEAINKLNKPNRRKL
jgi:DNA-binding NtrC family response regulator